MAGLFGGGGGSSRPVPPTVVRMPAQRDPNVVAAGLRAREDILKRSGRTSTVLSDTLRSLTGSKGRLGA